MDIFESIAAKKRTGTPFVLATVTEALGSTPREAGAKMLVMTDGSIEGTIGGGAVENIVVEEALKVFKAGESKTIVYDLGELKMQCGGKMTFFLEPIIPMPQLIIFGAGHIGFALSKMADMTGFRIVIVDNRPEFANSERFPNAQAIITKEYEQSFHDLHFDENTYAVIVTHKHLHDEVVLEKCAQQPFKYLGMIGSKTKVKKALSALKEKGVPADTVARINTPIGFAIGAQTPEEIAVAILAEMIANRHGIATTELSMKV